MSFADTGANEKQKRTPLLGGSRNSRSDLPTPPASPGLSTAGRITDAVRRIQQCAVDIQKDARLLNPSKTVAASREKVLAMVKDSRGTADQAKRWLSELDAQHASAGGRRNSTRGASSARMTHQKLSEDLDSACSSVEKSWAQFEEFEKDRQRSSQLLRGEGAQMQDFNISPSHTPELVRGHNDLAAGSGPILQAMMQDDVTDAEIETHAAIVMETATDLSRLSGEVIDLQQAMQTLHGTAYEQGETLEAAAQGFQQTEVVTRQAVEQVQIASNTQSRGNKWLMYMLAVVVVLSIIVVIIMATKHS